MANKKEPEKENQPEIFFPGELMPENAKHGERVSVELEFTTQGDLEAAGIWEKIKDEAAGIWEKIKDEPAGTWRDFKKITLSPENKEIIGKGNEEALNSYELKHQLKDDDLLNFADCLKAIYEIGNTNIEAVNNFFLTGGSSPVHYNFRSALARGHCEDKYQGWPATDISGSTFQGKAYFKKPVSITATDEELATLQENMKEKVLGLGKHGDLCADIFDIITAKWLNNARHEHDTVKINADEFLLARGLKARIWGKGKRGGFEEEQRKAVAEQIEYLDQAWVTVKEMEVIKVTETGRRKKQKWREDKKALHIDGVFGQQRLDGQLNVYQWEVKPGAVFAPFLYGPGRQTAFLSCKALQYDFYRQKWEKRIARYLAWIWRINKGNKKEGISVEKLLEAASMEIDKNRPGRTRDRLHKALDQLKKDGVITEWKESTTKDITTGRGWWRKWLESKVIVTAPKEILQHYEQIEKNRQKHLKGK